MSTEVADSPRLGRQGYIDRFRSSWPRIGFPRLTAYTPINASISSILTHRLSRSDRRAA